ncbi:MAG TPA: metal ABC transporter ATP-binding protein [Candidatus Limnocylindrales bacterium]|nr:metal ABC transporter ATP-binding protein [Candidatus Limnocylindrales bacterium]
MPAQIELINLSIGYGHQPLLEGITLSIQKGEFWGIVGPNGAGKSTLVKTILGILKPLQGRIEKIDTLTFGYVPQRSTLDDIFPVTALDVVLMGRYPARGIGRIRPEDRHLAHDYLEKVGASSIAGKLFRSLSGGQKQRVLIARALALEPDVLVLDEPMDGMDIAGEASIMELILKLRKDLDCTLLMVTHSLHLIANYGEKLILIRPETRRIEYGEVTWLLTQDKLREIYNLDLEVHNWNEHRVVLMRGSLKRNSET